VLEGFNGTIFAYGQTSSGKTHTMQGPDIENLEMQGIIPRMVRTVFNQIETASENIEFTVKVSMVEIYCERVKDLLEPSKDNLKIHEEKSKGVYIADLTEEYVAEEYEVFEIMKIGTKNRSISATLMNDESSRSHSIFILTVTQNNLTELSCKTGRLYLVDLAGSEKISKTGATGQTLDEAKMINKSLTTLGKVITALTDPKATHVPYRESKLTRILSESLGGNSKTSLIITGSPHPDNEAETLSTLRFG
jgi:kinesin family protein 5